jgi:hypothetical protein
MNKTFLKTFTRRSNIMKRSIILLTIIALVIIGLVSFSGTALTASPGTCCQDFHVQTEAGIPIEGCTVYYGSCILCQCTTDRNGDCTICGLTVGNTYEVSVNCGSGGATFKACQDEPVVIIVH